MKLPKILHSILLGTLVFGLWAGPAWADEPQAAVRRLLEAIRQVHHQKPLTAEQKQSNEEVTARALTHLDVGMVARKTLGKHWKDRSSAEQKEFTQLLGDLFRYVAFPSSSKFFGEMNLKYAATEKAGAQVTVPLTVVHPDEGEVSLAFVMEQNFARWKVVDVVLDGVSMRNNLRTQFAKVLKKHDYPELLRRMNKKLQSARE